MEAAAIIATVRVTTSTAIQARTLCVIWKDAPRDIFRLRDELDTCKSFLDSLESGLLNSNSSCIDDSITAKQLKMHYRSYWRALRTSLSALERYWLRLLGSQTSGMAQVLQLFGEKRMGMLVLGQLENDSGGERSCFG